MKLWEKGHPLDKKIEAFTVGDDYLLDQKLVPYDCLASIAHVRMLGQIGILQKNEVEKLVRELNRIVELDRKSQFKILKEDEDCHTAIENHLIGELGKLGEKVHTARSRNDQVLTALRLYEKDRLTACRQQLEKLIGVFRRFVKQYGQIQLPGYTHMRKAMVSSIGLWGQGFIDSMKDNVYLIDCAYKLIDQCPLGTGAGYGVPIKIDRPFVARLLKFKRVQKNPIYAQHSRGKFESTLLHSLSQIMIDLNKIATDLVLFSMDEFGYFELPKSFCTGSSIMPQKQNPDVLELIRAKYHLLVAYEMQIKNITGNLISGYHRDFQLTKEPVMKGFEITLESLAMMSLIISKIKVNRENCKKGMTPELFATERVYELVKQGMSFREAYRKIAEEY
ncbi:argininosuccinate lyase [bacterium]|nr:argininosuccinate lyase [bacterium]